MSDRHGFSGLQAVISLVIVSLIVAYLVRLLTSLMGVVGSAVTGALAGAVLMLANYQATRFLAKDWRYYLWRLVPLLILVVGPVAWWWWREEGAVDWIFWLDVGAGLLLPVLLLVYVHARLGQKGRRGDF